MSELNWYRIPNVTNIEFAEDSEGMLLMKVNPNLSFGPTSSGKSNIVASTKGAKIVMDVNLNINVYKAI